MEEDKSIETFHTEIQNEQELGSSVETNETKSNVLWQWNMAQELNNYKITISVDPQQFRGWWESPTAIYMAPPEVL